jgi:hypothetical protein
MPALEAARPLRSRPLPVALPGVLKLLRGLTFPNGGSGKSWPRGARLPVLNQGSPSLGLPGYFGIAPTCFRLSKGPSIRYESRGGWD